MSVYGKTDLAQAMADHLKVARVAIRLKYSLAADHELNRIMPVLEQRLAEMMQEGKIPEMGAADILQIAEGLDDASSLS